MDQREIVEPWLNIRAGFLKYGDNEHTIDIFGAQKIWAHGINNSGVIAGYFTDGDGIQHGFVTLSSWDFIVSDSKDYITDSLTLGNVISLEIWWEIGEAVSEGCPLEILVKNSSSEWESVGQIVPYGSSTEWESTEVEIPMEFWQNRNQLRLKFTDCGL